MPYRIFSIVDGSTFVVSNGRGDLDAAPDRLHGFFADDTRFVSRWRLTLDGEELDTLSIGDTDYFAVQFFLVPHPDSVWQNPTLSIMRRRLVRVNWLEEVRVINHADSGLEAELSIDVESDFADMFEVRDGEVREREVRREPGDRELLLSYRRDEFLREIRIAADHHCQVHEHGFRSRLSLAPGEERRLSFELSPRSEPRQAGLPTRTGASSFEVTRAELRDELDAWLADAPALETDWDALDHLYHQSLVDLAALRCFPNILPGGTVPAAGLPWFMALFGRDSLITSYQALPMRPELARSTLIALAALQARDFDDFRDAEPGKILHELRFGELTVTGERPHSPYYGTADATPLFLVLLDELERWTGDAELVRRLEPNARAALEWIDRHGDLDGDGYVEYRRRNVETGLENQCWKDSHNSMLFADGSKAAPPIATCEIQGYVYDAKRRCSRLARDIWGDKALAERLEREAAELRRRFHEDFWIEDGGYYALALDGEKRKVDSLSSNIGHLLWSGIVDAEPAEEVAAKLMGGRLFSGWGVRTMAVGDGGYNPIEYHNGTVWPHDCSLIAHGLGRYGYRAEAARIAVALVEAGERFDYRLPEVFTGYPRAVTDFPVQYPTASRPQAWATGAPLLLIRTLLGLEPEGDQLVMDPWLPDRIGRLGLRGVPGRSDRALEQARGEATTRA
jgi:glycogen debranching enzyme